MSDELVPILHGIGRIFIEMRHATNIETVNKFADIFHNVPFMIAVGRPAEEIIETILAKADRYGLRSQVLAYIEE